MTGPAAQALGSGGAGGGFSPGEGSEWTENGVSGGCGLGISGKSGGGFGGEGASGSGIVGPVGSGIESGGGSVGMAPP